jgi:hypothetical protein
MLPYHLEYEMKQRERELARSLERRMSWRLNLALRAPRQVVSVTAEAPMPAPRKDGKPRAA